MPNAHDSSPAFGWETVRQSELDEIVKRRRAAGLPVPEDAGDARTAASETLAGVALSGGGIRSASFNLGLLQAFYSRGFLRVVDYLSTVSGGGYVGGYLSSLAIRCRGNNIFARGGVEGAELLAEDRETQEVLRQSALHVDQHDRHSHRALRFIRSGRYLAKPLQFVNRWLIGVFLINLVLLSAVVSVVALSAIAFRCLDLSGPMAWINALGFQDDVQRALFPSFLLFIAWFVAWVVSYWRSGSRATGAVARYLALFFLVSLLVALAALLGTGDVDFNRLSRALGLSLDAATVKGIETGVAVVLAVAILVGLLPYLRPDLLIRSGVRPNNPVERVIFWVASRALLVGFPLLLFAWIGRENISQYNEARPHLVFQDVRDPGGFWNQLHLDRQRTDANVEPARSIWLAVERHIDREFIETAQARGLHGANRITDWTTFWEDYELALSGPASTRAWDSQTPGAELWNELLGRRHPTAGPRVETPPGKNVTVLDDNGRYVLDYVLQLDADLSRAEAINDSLWFWQRWLLLLDCWHDQHANRLQKMVHLRLNALARKAALFRAISDDVLSQPDFWRLVTRAGSFDPKPTARPVRAAKQEPAAESVAAGNAGDAPNPGSADDAAAASGADDQGPSADTPATRDEAFHQLVTTAVALEKRLRGLRADGGRQVERDRQNLVEDIQRNNRDLLKAYYHPWMHKNTPVYALAVASEDQRTRLQWLLWSLVVCLISAALVNMNDTSMHGFYQRQLSEMWLEEIPGLGRTIPLSRLETTAKGAPYHLISATLNTLGQANFAMALQHHHFLFSYGYCGSAVTGFQATHTYLAGRYDLGNAIAISGAAVSPLQISNPLVSLLLLLLNFRLGQWLPNPELSGIAAGVTPLQLLRDLFRRPGQRHYCFITDGGHYENLGLESLLRRRCRLIVVSDATCDPGYGFAELLRVQRRMRVEDGIRLWALDADRDLPLDSFQPREADAQPGHSPAHFVVGRIRYPMAAGPDGVPQYEWGLLVYLKPTLTGDEGVELEYFRRGQQAFPHDTTANQVYDETRFEAYRQLGYHIGDSLCAVFTASPPWANQSFRPLGDYLRSMASTFANGRH
jgi:hypothetical protein